MKISVERRSWTDHNPELVVLIGDPYADFIGELPDTIADRVAGFAEGFGAKRLKREISFSAAWGDSQPLDCVYFHTSTERGFTHTENLKTFVARALRMASDTGRSRVAVLLKGAGAEGLVDQLVEGALVGTWSFREYKKEQTDPFEDMELIFCLASPPMIYTEVDKTAEVVASQKAPSISATVAIDPAGTSR